jgi:hypothetical protein
MRLAFLDFVWAERFRFVARMRCCCWLWPTLYYIPLDRPWELPQVAISSWACHATRDDRNRADGLPGADRFWHL